MDILGAVAIALLLLLGRDQIVHGELTPGLSCAFIIAGVQTLRSGAQVRALQ